MFHDLIDLWNFEANKRGVTTGGIVTCRNIGFVLLAAVTRRCFTFSSVNENIQLIKMALKSLREGQHFL